jgi:uncharacterized protein
MEIQIREEQIDFFAGKEEICFLHVSDIHLWFSDSVLITIKKQIHQHKPEFVLFTGDYFDFPKGARLFRDFLSEISIDFKVIFTRGNHDRMYGKKISGLLDNIPNCFCVDDVCYSHTSAKGFTYNFYSWDSREHVRFNKNQKNIVLIHNPERLNENELEHINLILAGHLHGGQFVFFKTSRNSFFPGNMLYKYCTDKRQINDTTLIVSRGVGDTLPLRFNCPREIVKIGVR